MKTMRGKENWNVIDLSPGVPLDQIESLAHRAHTLLARSTPSDAVQQGFIDIAGAIDMLSGLEYHHRNFVRAVSEIEYASPDTERSFLHEAVGYINRMGQFYTFAHSRFVKQFLRNADRRIPTFERLIIFRDKHTAHRSLDAPKPDEEAAFDVTVNHAMSLSSNGGRLLRPRPGSSSELSKLFKVGVPMSRDEMTAALRVMYRDSFLIFMIFDAKNKRQVEFSLEEQHPVICGEAYGIIEKLITCRKST